ncbi:MAG: polyphenol oxidase family protein, partial [Ignavibacteriaceae bacterium]|nr:polyphenol oxidase family protein [Ignavibacteriaceae bacterium]
MFIIKPHIFNSFPQIVAGVSTKIGHNGEPPYCFNLSLNVDDDITTVLENRKIFFGHLEFKNDEIVYQNQIHSDIITIVESSGNCGESDALITSRFNLALVLTIADCTPIL